MNELLNALFGDDLGTDSCTHARNSYAPKADVVETKESYILEMDLPGYTEDSIDIDIKDRVLTVSKIEEARQSEEKAEEKDEKSEASEKEQPVFLLKERTDCSFKRSFKLPQDADEENISARLKNGVLAVTVRKRPAVQPKKITIFAA